MSEIKTEIKEEVKDKDVSQRTVKSQPKIVPTYTFQEKFERAEMDEVEVDFTGSSANGTIYSLRIFFKIFFYNFVAGPTWTKEMIDQIVVEVKKRYI